MTLDPRDADPFRAEGTDDEPETPVASDLIVFGGIVFVGLVVVAVLLFGKNS